MVTSAWHVRLGATAQEDYQDILQWTMDQFGVDQALTYADTLMAALEDLCAGPDMLGVKTRKEIGSKLYILHVARKGQKGRQLVETQRHALTNFCGLRMYRLKGRTSCSSP